MVGLSLRSIPIDSRYLFVELKPGPRFTAGRYFTLELSVETRVPGCQRTPDTEHVCPISQISGLGNTRPGPASYDVDWAFRCVVILIHTFFRLLPSKNLPETVSQGEQAMEVTTLAIEKLKEVMEEQG